MSDPDASPVLPAHAGSGTDSRDILVGYAFAAIGAVLFSAKGIVVKLAYIEGIEPAALLALRMLVALPIYFVIGGLAVAATRCPPRRWSSRRRWSARWVTGSRATWISSACR